MNDAVEVGPYPSFAFQIVAVAVAVVAFVVAFVVVVVAYAVVVAVVDRIDL